MEIAMIGLHKRFCDESFFESVYKYITQTDFLSDDIVLLLTCNRIEIYLASSSISERHPQLLEKIKQPFKENVEKRFYTFIGVDVLRHLAQVTSGLDSLIYGETDIQHQVRKAYESMGKGLNADGHFLFQKAFHISKKLRQEFDIRPVKSLVDHVMVQIDPLINENDELVFIGNSDLNQKIFKKITNDRHIKSVIISRQKPKEGSPFYHSRFLSYDDLKRLGKVDGIICATHAHRIKLEPEMSKTGWICDLSRPKVITQTHSNYFDLQFFENISAKIALKQCAARLDAMEYINSNVKRLLTLRLLRQNSFAS